MALNQKVNSEALGHRSAALQWTSPGHIIEGMRSDARTILDGVLPAGKNGVSQKNNADLTPKADITALKN